MNFPLSPVTDETTAATAEARTDTSWSTTKISGVAYASIDGKRSKDNDQGRHILESINEECASFGAAFRGHVAQP